MYGQDHPVAKRREGRPTREWLQLAAAVVGLLAAVVGGVYGVLANKAKAEAQATTINVQNQASDAQAQIDSLNKQIAALKTENQILQNRLATQPASPSPSPSVVTAADIFHKGTVTLVRGRRVDLDALPSDPQWGTLVDDGWHVDIGWGNDCDGICFGHGNPAFYAQDNWIIADATANKETCSTLTGYAKGDISITKVKKGFTFCVVTGDGRTSVVQVTGFTNATDPIVLDITTYAKPGD